MGMIDMTGRRDDKVATHVGSGEKVPEVLLRNTGDGIRRPQDGTAEGMLRPKGRRKHLMNEVIWDVLDHLDFFENDLLFFLEIFLAKRRT